MVAAGNSWRTAASPCGLGPAVPGGRLFARAERGNVGQPADARLGRRAGDPPRSVDMQGVEALPAGFEKHGDGVDAPFGPVQGARHRGLIADIGLEDFDLADIAEHRQSIAPPRVSHRDPHPRATPGQRAHDLTAHETGAAEHSHQTLHGYALSLTAIASGLR